MIGPRALVQLHLATAMAFVQAALDYGSDPGRGQDPGHEVEDQRHRLNLDARAGG